MKRILHVLFLCFSSLILNSGVQAQTFDPGYQDGKIWFKLKDDLPMSSEEALSFLNKMKAHYQITETGKAFKNIQGKSPLQQTYLLRFSDIEKTKQLIEALRARPEIAYAEQVPLDKLLLTPNDPSLSTQWHLSAIGAASAWNYFSSGSSIVVAIVDDAVETTHSDLSGNIWVNPGEIADNGIDDDGNGYIDDINGWDLADNDNNPNPSSIGLDHGTHVAGIVSAVSNNGTGIASMGYSCKLMCIKSTNVPISVTYGYEGIIYAANNNADVINLSWGGSYSSITAENVINYALAKNCIIVAAAGNDNVNTPFYPADFDGVIAVAATNSSNQKASFSNYGSWVDISAPGENIYSTTVGNSYGYKSGTSMASPLVAGLVGLMRSLNPGMPPEDVKNCLFSTAVNIDASNPAYVGSLGAGRIDAAAAMACVNSSLDNAPVANFSASNTNIQEGVNVTFTDLSTYNPTSWSWSFPGGTPSSFNGQNPPEIQYNTPGSYDVTLVTSNANGTDAETKTDYITVAAASGGCYSINLPTPAGWSTTNYYTGINGSDGWINGVNVYLDKEKAMYFDASSLAYSMMTKLYIGFGMAYTNDPTKEVPVHIYDGSTGLPGALIGSSSLTMSTIMDNVDNGVYTQVDFNTPITLPASKKFFVSVVLTNLQWTSAVHDTLSILSNAAGQTVPSAIWEKQSNNSWYQYSSTGSWNLNASLYIHPFLTNQAADASFTASATNICAGEIINFNALDATTGGGFIWDFSGGIASGTNSLTPSVIYNTPGTYQAILTVAGGGCNDIVRDTVNITVNATPVITISAGTNPICLGTSTTLTASGADTYSWTPSTGLNTTTGTSVTATPTSTTTYTVVGTIGGCANSSSLELQVANVTASHVSTDVSCNGGSNGTATVTPTGGTAPYTYSWSPSGGIAATATGLAAGTYSCTITDNNACTHIESTVITEPGIITGTDVQTICDGDSYTFNGIDYTTDNNTATATFVAANGCDSIVTLHLTVSSHTLAGTTGTAVNSQTNGTIAYTNNSCEMIATINSGANNLGTVTSDVFVGMVILPGEEPYLSRYYDIETSLPGGAEVTLYFSQQEIDDYNTFVGTDNPLYPQIGSNGENLQITAFHSAPGSGNGPGGYDTAAALKEVIPCTAVWNAVESRWEITFTTSQFSGFFAHTNNSGSPLPVKLGNITATNAGDRNLVEWNTLTETGMDYFEVERSRDAMSFESIGNMKAKGVGSAYRFVDQNPYSGYTYYRLKMWNIDGTYAYSRVVKAEMHTGAFHVIAFPNPVMDKLTLRIDGVISGKGFITISDLSGRKMFDVPVDNDIRIMEISMQNMAQGMYFLKYQDNQVSHIIKIEKQ